MKRRIVVFLIGTGFAVAACGCCTQAMAYGYDMGEKGIYISGTSSSSDLTEGEKKKLSDWHKEEMRNELAYLKDYGVTYDADRDTLYYQGKTVRCLIDEQIEDTYTMIQMPEGEIDIYTVRGADYRLTGVRIATQEEYDRQTRRMEVVGTKECSSTEDGADAEAGSVIHTFTYYDERTEAEVMDGSGLETAVVAEDVVSGDTEGTVEMTAEGAQDTRSEGERRAAERKLQEYKQNGIDMDSETGSWSWQGKEVQLLMDEDGSFYQNGGEEAKENSIYLIVKRKEDGSIKTVRQMTIEEAMAERIESLGER